MKVFRPVPALSVVLSLTAITAAFAADGGNHSRLLPTTDVIVVEAPTGTAFLSHPLLVALRDEVTKSAQWKTVQSSPQYDRLQLIAELLKQATGQTWNKALDELTGEGVAASFSPGQQNGLTLVIAARNEKSLRQFVTVVRKKVESRLPAAQRSKAYATRKFKRFEYTRFGKAAYVIIGNRLIFGSTEQRLQDALTRLEVRKEASEKSTEKPALRVTVKLDAVRNIPNVQKALKLPAKDAGQVAVFGGWFDLLRRGKELTAELHTDDDALSIHVRSKVKHKDLTAGLQGYFADGKESSAAPLLKIPGSLYTASWYRDYRSLWQGRESLLAAATRKKLEDGDRTVQKQLSVIGAKAAPSEVFSLLGPHLRVVVAPAGQSDYKIELPNRLPAAALAVDLRDEAAFRDKVLPFLRGVGLIAAFGPNKMQTIKTQHSGAELTSLRFPQDEVSTSKGNHIRFNFAPTYVITRGHFIAGSTRGIVTRVIDELDRQRSEKRTQSTGVTEMQQLSLAAFSKALDEFEGEFVRVLVFNNGYSVSDAHSELGILKTIVQRIGSVTTQAGFDQRGFRYDIRIGGKGEAK